MEEAAVLSALIGEIYDCVLQPGRWPATLEALASFVGGKGAAIYSKDARQRSGAVYFEVGIDPSFTQLYFDKYVKLDPATNGHYFAEVGEPTATKDVIPYDEFLETRFYKEWVAPQHLVDHITVVLDKSATSVALFGVFRHESDGVADDEARRKMRLVAPHIRRAVLIGRVIDFTQTEAATLADTLDGLSSGLFLVDENSRVVHANRAGRSLLDAGLVLRGSGERLEGSTEESQRALQSALAAAASGDAAIGSRGVAVPLSYDGGQPYVAHVLPLTSGSRRQAGQTLAATAAVFVSKATLAAPSPPEIIAKTYKLTPTELRVLLAIVEVGGVPEVAEALGTADTTIKTHLGHVYEKTGTRRQADLVKLVAGFSSPLIR